MRSAVRRGLSLAELLVVLSVMALVTVIAIPTVTGQIERAKISSARADVRAIAQAQEACAAYHGFYVPLRVLDDLPADTIIADRDAIDREPPNDVWLIDPLQDPTDQITTQLRLSQSGNTGRVQDLLENWAGPFIDFQRVAHGPNPEDQIDISRDFPLDPWGYPYRWFSDDGIIGSGANRNNIAITDIDNLNFDFDDGRLTTNLNNYNNTGRYLIVSLGRDGDYDTFTDDEEGDDIFYAFSLSGFESRFQTRFPF